MTIGGTSVGLSVTLPVHGSQAPKPAVQNPGGNALPPSGTITPAVSLPAVAAYAAHNVAPAASTQTSAAQTPAAAPKVAPPSSSGPVIAAAAANAQSSASNSSAAPDSKTVVAALNKFLNDTGRPDEFRLEVSNGVQVIQQVNPANGEVIGEFSAVEFPALAQAVVAGSGAVNSTA
jgi:hypothetical protein